MADKKIGIITSRGGHLYQMYCLEPWWKKYGRFWVTFQGDDESSMLKNEKIYYGYSPESRNIINAIRNFIYAGYVLIKEKPDLLISCGSAIAPPFFYMGKLLGIKLVFIEPFDFIQYPSLSGKMVYPIVDTMLVQHKKQLDFFPNALYRGSVL